MVLVGWVIPLSIMLVFACNHDIFPAAKGRAVDVTNALSLRLYWNTLKASIPTVVPYVLVLWLAIVFGEQQGLQSSTCALCFWGSAQSQFG